MIGNALEATCVNVVFAEAAVRVVAGRLVRLQHAGRFDAELAMREGECIGTEAAAEQPVAKVADHAQLVIADVALFQASRRRIADHVDEPLVLVRQLRDKVAVARAHDRVKGVDALHLTLACRIEVGEVLRQPVFELRPAHANARAVVPDGNEVGEAGVPHAFVGGETAEACLVAITERRVPVEVGARAVLAGEAVAVIVGVDEPVQYSARLGNVDAQVGGAERPARPDLGGHLCSGQIVDDEQRPLEAGLGDDLALLEMRAEDADEQAVRDARTRAAIELQLPDASLEDADLDSAAVDRLLRQISLGEEVAARTIERAHFRRRLVQAFEIELLADELLDQGLKLRLRVKRVAGEGELLDLDLELRQRRQRGLGLRRLRQYGLRRRGQAKRLACLLEHLAGVGALLCIEVTARDGEKNETQRLRGALRAPGGEVSHLVTPAFFYERGAHDRGAQATTVFGFAAAGKRKRYEACACVVAPRRAAWDKAVPSPFGQSASQFTCLLRFL